jgi:TP901 family phage tail tape measure protein
MATSLFALGFVLEAYDHASHAIHQVEGSLKALNVQAGSMHHLREVSEQMAIAGAAMTGAGLGIAFALKSTIEPAIESAHATAQLSAVTGLHGHILEKVDQAALKYSNDLIGSEEAYKQVFAATTRLLNQHVTLKDAFAATSATMQLAAVLGSDVADTSGVITKAYQTMGDVTKPLPAQIEHIGDMFLATREKYGVRDITQFNAAFGRIAPLAGEMNVSMGEVLSILGVLQRDLTPRAPMQFANAMAGVIANTKKFQELGIEWRAGESFLDLIDKIGGAVGNLEPNERLARVERVFGGGMGPAVLDLIRWRTEMRTAGVEITNTHGMLEAKMRDLIATDPEKAFTLLGQVIHNTAVEIGKEAIPATLRWTERLTDAFHAVQEFSKAHPVLIETGLKTAALGAAALIVGGSILAMVGSIGFFVSYAPAALGFLVSLVTGFIGVAGAAYGAAAAIVVFLATNPFGWLILTVGALGVLAYKWEEVKDLGAYAWTFIQLAAVEAWAAIVATVTAAWEKIQPIFHAIAHPIETVKLAVWGATSAPLTASAPIAAAEASVPASFTASTVLQRSIERSTSIVNERSASLGLPASVDNRKSTTIHLNYSPTINASTPEGTDLQSVLSDHTADMRRMLGDLQRRESRVNY